MTVIRFSQHGVVRRQNNMRIYSTLSSWKPTLGGLVFICQVYLESTQVCPTLVLGSDLGLLTSKYTI